MKHGLTLKLLLKATAACVLLTLLEILFDRLTHIHTVSRTDVEMVFAWLVVGIGWIIYLAGLFRKYRKSQEEEPWHQKEKDPW